MKYACFLFGWMIAGLPMALPCLRAQTVVDSPLANRPEQSADKWQPPAAKWTRAELEVTPKRELESESLDSKLPRGIDRPDPSLLDQKFAAMVKLDVPKPSDESPRRILDALPEEDANQPLTRILRFNPLGNVQGLSEILNRRSKDSTFGYPGTVAPAILDELMAQVPKGRLQEGDLDFLKNGDSHSFVQPVKDARGVTQEFQMTCYVYGKTPEDCMRNVRTLLTVFDEGMSRPVQLFLYDQRGQQVDRLTHLQQAFAKLQAEADEVRAKLKSFVDLTPDLMLGLRQRQLDMDVEVVGTRAKIEICRKLLDAPAGKDEVSIAQRATIASAKVEAEIALASFEARGAKLNELVTNVKAKTDLSRKLGSLSAELNAYPQSLRETLRQIQIIDAHLALYAPLPVVDNNVVIQPIEWIAARQ